MRIALETRAIQKKSGGTKTYTQKLVEFLPKVGLGHEYLELAWPRENFWQVPWWFYVTLPREIARLQPDVVHFTKSALPPNLGLPTVVTIYDIIPILFPESQNFWPRILWPEVLRQAVHKSSHVITISESSRRDIVQHFALDPAKVIAIPLASNPTMFAEGQSKALNVSSKPFLLWVGTIEPRKNVPLLIRAFAQLAQDIPHNLLIVGRDHRGLKEVKNTIAQTGLEQRVELRGRVEQTELKNLYQQADLFVWPSLYEGWGFPPQEAMAAGTPVIVSNGGSLPEVVGSGGMVVPFTEDLSLTQRKHDQQFEDYLARAIVSLLDDKEKQHELSLAGKKQAQRYSWSRVAEETIAVYEKIA